jgi:hypothetical protein
MRFRGAASLLRGSTFLAAVLCTGVHAQGFYQALQHRANDPFVFCTYGQKIAIPCWKPLPPFTGNWMFTGACNPPNQYGRSWTNDDIQAFAEYLTACPQAMTSGDWNGNGDGTSVPVPH